MPLVTGSILDAAGVALDPSKVRITFELKNPAFKPGGGTFSKGYLTKQVVDDFTPTGTFSQELVSNTDLVPPTPYIVRVEWLEGNDPFLDQQGYVLTDTITHELWVPSGGGALSDLIETPLNPSLVWVGDTEPPNPKNGMLWLYTGTTKPGTTYGTIYQLRS